MNPKLPHRSALAAISLVLPASAEVIYSNLQDISIPATYDGVYLNVENGAWNTDMFSPVSGWDINPYFGGSVLFNSPNFQPVRSGTGNMDAVLNLSPGTSVSGSSVFSTFVQGPGGENPGGPGYGGSDTHLGGGVGQFSAGTEGFLGFRLNGTNYGWMRVVLTNNTGGALIKDWAYDNSGAAINTGNVLQSGSTVTLNSAFGSFTLGSQLTGSNSVLKTGINTATLSAANNYSGTTTVSVGRLNVNGSITSATSVAGGAALGGDGTITGDVSVAGTLFAGQGGTTDRSLTINGNVTTVTGSVLSFTVDAMNDHDQLVVSGANSIGLGNAELDVTFGGGLSFTDLVGGEGAEFLAAISSNDFSSIGGTWFKLIEGNTTGMFTNTSTLTSGELSYLGLTGTQYAYDLDGQRFWLAQGSTYLVAVPEPRAALLGGLGLLMLLRRRR